MSLDTASALTAPRLALDEARLLAYLRSSPAFSGVPLGSLRVQQFKHGQSNPTYLLELGGQRLVLRKQPPGKLLASAHAVDREYRVLKAMADHSTVPVPRPLVLCTDSSVIGTPFYVMEFAAGRIFVDPNMPDATPQQRSAAYTQLAQTLAALHKVSPSAAGLEGYGNPTSYCRRQLSRWAVQYVASVAQPMPEVLRLIGWLQAHMPAADATASAVVHGDYRLDNLVFDEATMKVKAVLDWELSTLGNPWADAAYMCMSHHLPPQLTTLQLARPLAPGVSSEAQLLGDYCAAAGVEPPPAKDWAFYLALSVFRLLAILAGVQSRAKQGNAASAHAKAISSDAVLSALAAAALAIISRAGGDPSAICAETVAAQIAAPMQVARGSNGSSDGRNGSGSRGHGSSSASSSASNGGGRSGGSGSSGGRGSRAVHERAPVLGEPSARAKELLAALRRFVVEAVCPAEEVLEAHAAGDKRWTVHPLVEELKGLAKAQGLWNLWMPADMAAKLQHLLPMVPQSEHASLLGAQLSNLDYAHLCEEMGRSFWAPEVFNCSAPDTGNMEVLARYGSRAQQERWLLPLLRGHIRSCFAMTEKQVASSDATNITASIARAPGGGYVLDGIKWWTSGAMDPRCKVCIFMGKTDPSAPQHAQQSMALVPFDAPGITVIRPLTVMGYDDAPHGHAEVHFKGVQVGADAIILGEGRGFEIAQGRLGPGRLHHCMRLVGMGERAIQLMAQRALQRKVFGKPLAAQGGFLQSLAKCRVELDGARLMVLAAAHALDRVGNKRARAEIAAAKVAAPNAVLHIVDAAMQAHGAAGVSQDTVLAHFWAAARTLRLADGPDEVHLESIAKLELSRARAKL